MREKTYCKCSYCGYEKAVVDTNTILKTYPEKYNFYCPECKAGGYVVCENTYKSCEKEEQIEALKKRIKELLERLAELERELDEKEKPDDNIIY